LTNPPQKVLDVHAIEDLGEIPEAEAYANVGAFTSLLDLAVGAATNVGAPTSPTVLDVVVAANVGATTSLTIGLGQTTPHTLGSMSEVDLGHSLGGSLSTSSQ